jgi:peptide/nickel transport system ATP-binding protein
MAESTLLEVEHLAKAFDFSSPWLSRVVSREPKRYLHAVDDVSFTIRRGETMALVGESGCGKSTVARLVVGLLRPDRGTVRLAGEDITRARNDNFRRRLQMIFQDPYASLNPRWRVGDVIAEPIDAFGLAGDAKDRRARIGRALTQVGLNPADARKYPHEFSGGQRQRISIARALAGEPEFLVCDEPTSALDVSVQAQILNLMKDLQRRLGLTYLFISHNLAVVEHMADQVGVMYLGRLCEVAPARELFARPRHPYTRLLLETIPDLKMAGGERVPLSGEVPSPLDPPTGCAFHPRCPAAFSRCSSERPELLPSGEALAACHAVAEGRITARRGYKENGDEQLLKDPVHSTMG